MNPAPLDLDLTELDFEHPEPPLMPPEQWDEWLRHQRLRLIAEGKIDPNEIPVWKGGPFEWKD